MVRPLRFEPIPDASFCVSQEFSNAVRNPVIVKLDFLLNWPCSSQYRSQQRVSGVLSSHMRQEGHGNADVEIEGIDCFQLSDAEIFKIKNLFFRPEILLNPPTREVKSGNFYHVFLTGYGLRNLKEIS